LKLVKLRLKNFRVYEEIEIDFNENLNVIIGRNDVGKSTILDALNFFFNNEPRLDPLDCHIDAIDKVIEIHALFKVGDRNSVILDATNPTTFKEEFLLNEDGYLEVRKIINAAGKTITANSVSVEIVARHPDVYETPLITLTVSKLRDLLKQYKDQISNYEDINKSKKADMRQSLFSLLVTKETEFNNIHISLKDLQEDTIKSWNRFRENLPIYNLFQSDRTNTDGDKEVQDPMKAITREVLSTLEPELNEIRDEVVKRVEEIGKETVEKLKDLDEEISSELTTLPDLRNWDTIFRFSLDTDDDIPLNKRGSGVRRLVLLSYFQAQAERIRTTSNNTKMIFAIEEPETSQHPNYQKMLIDALTEISRENNNQVFITTHTPEIAKLVNSNELIMISRDNDNNPVIIKEQEIKLSKISETLGVLPTISSRMVICVEGKNDINFLYNINQAVPEFKAILDLEKEDISIYELGGSRLIDWVNQNHFKSSNIKEFHLYDGDDERYKKVVDEINEAKDGRRYGSYTSLREMENYIPLQLIEKEFGCELDKYTDNWDERNVPRLLMDKVCLDIPYNSRETAIKGMLNTRLTKKVTADMFRAHGVYDEIENWFKLMRDIYDGRF